MSDIDKIKLLLATAKREHDARVAALKSESDRKEAERLRQQAAGAAWLRQHVLPAIEALRAAAPAEGFRVELSENVRQMAHDALNAAVSFRLASARPGRVGEIAHSPTFTFHCDGADAWIVERGGAEESVRTGERVGVAGADELAFAGIRQALDAYYGSQRGE
jgi:hypothetical protein